MRIGGIDPKTLPNEEILVLARGDQNLVIRAQGLPNMEEFNTLCPEPKPPGRLTKDGYQSNYEDPDYKQLRAIYENRRMAYLVVFSLKPSQIEWDQVKEGSPASWELWEADMKNAGITHVECNLILNLVLGANSLDELKLRRARETFLHGLKAASAQ